MGKCVGDKNLYTDIEFCQGSKSMPGVRDHFYYVRRRDIMVFPKPQGTEAASIKDVAVIKDDFVLAEDAKFLKVSLVPNESEVTSESQGSYGSKTFLNKTPLVLPGTEEENTGFIAMLNNDDIVALVPQRNGKLRVLGNEAFQVGVNPSQGSGKSETDSNTTTVELSVTDEYPAPFYQGKFLTSDGYVDGKTDTITSDQNEGGANG